MRAAPVVRPCDRMNAGLDARTHQFMIRRMKIDLVDALTETVEGFQYRRESVRRFAVLQHRCRSHRSAEFTDSFGGPSRAFALHTGNQRSVELEQIDVFQR